MKKFADFIIEKRLLVLILIFSISLFFLYKLKDLEVYTKFDDLLPQKHEYIKVHNKIRAQFGGANTINMVLQVKEGDIFNPTTLQKIRGISDELYLIPGVDKILDISRLQSGKSSGQVFAYRRINRQRYAYLFVFVKKCGCLKLLGFFFSYNVWYIPLHILCEFNIHINR